MKNTLERIATALERIANRIDPKPTTPDIDVTALVRQVLESLNGNGKPEPTTEKAFYTVKETAEMTPFAEYTIRQRCNKGMIDGAVKQNDQWRIPKAAVDRIISQGLPELRR